MILTIKNEVPFQILSSSFSIGPSETGYDLQVGADSRNFTTLFSVGANTPRMVTNVANGSYFRLKNNVGDVKVNWQRVCVNEGGEGGSGTELQPVADFPLNAVEGTVISYTGSSSASGIYQFDGTDWVEAGGSIDPSVLEGYATSGDMQSAFTLISETQQVAAAGLNQLEGRIDELSGATPDLSAYYTSAQTEAAIAQAVSGLATEQYVQDALSGVNMDNYWTSAETKNAIDEAISGFTPSANSPIIPAITSQAEYGAISGDVKTGDLIQVRGVVLDGYVGPQYGLFEASVEEEEDGGVVRKIISWSRKDNSDSVFWSEDYPWMSDNDVNPVDFQHSFLIALDELAEDEAYNGIGFDGDGKPVITHFSPQYDDDGEVTGITREDTPIGADMSAYYTSAQTEDAITSKNYVTSAQVETQIEAKNYVNSGDVKSQVEAYNYATVSQIPTVPTSNTAFTNDAGYITDAAIENLVTSAQVETQIDTKAAAYTPTSGFSTINGSAITNGGNIVIEGGADMSAYYTSAQTEEAITSKNYVTSAQVETQIVSKNYITSAETANFVTSAQVETQITSKGYATVSQIPTVPTSNTAFTNDAGYITSAAIADKVSSTSVSTIWRGTAAEYEAITVKDPTTFYIIVNN